MGEIILNGKSYNSGMKYKEVTQAEYNALPSSKLTDGTLYCITDAPGPGEGFPPLIYSTEEREIGVWTNGKPLYQKTKIIPKTSTSITNKCMTLPVLETGEELINVVEAMAKDTTYGTLRLFGPGYVSNNAPTSYFTFGTYYSGLCIYTTEPSYWANMSEIRITYQYTKTTDQAGSGTWTPDGIYTKHYSTSEKVIGTWIDGKPIYEKTIEITTFPNSEIVYIAHGIANISEFIEIKGTAHVVSSIDSTNYWDSLSRVQDNNAAALIALGANDTNVLLKGRGSNMSDIYDYGYVTLQYTKTID